MKLIVGLGNPGKQYEKTRHNIGFRVLDQLTREQSGADFQLKKKFKALVAEKNFGAEKIILAKPQTLMNKSGEAVIALVNFYKIKPMDVWLVHDEIDLPLGSIRINQGAGPAGHNGVKSVIQVLGTKNFIRFRVGIGWKKPLQIPTEKFVLQRFSLLEKKKVDKVRRLATKALRVALERNPSYAMTILN